jgi:YD repeat-containing protein
MKRGQVRFFLASDPYAADSVTCDYDSFDHLTRTTDAYGNSQALAYDRARCA